MGGRVVGKLPLTLLAGGRGAGGGWGEGEGEAWGDEGARVCGCAGERARARGEGSPFGLSQRSNSAIVAGRREISMSSFILDQVEGYSVTRAARTCDSEAAARIVLR